MSNLEQNDIRAAHNYLNAFVIQFYSTVWFKFYLSIIDPLNKLDMLVINNLRLNDLNGKNNSS